MAYMALYGSHASLITSPTTFPLLIKFQACAKLILILESLHLLLLSLEHSSLSLLHSFLITQSKIVPCPVTVYYMILFYFLHDITEF